MPVYDYNKAISTTIDFERSFSGKLFQIMIIFVTTSALNSSNFLILGLPFMKSAPEHFTCKDRESGEWKTCDKAYICGTGLSRDEYEPDKGEYKYIDNWNGQANMLCEPKERIGLLGACFFIGVLCASIIIPVGYLSDILGRKWLFISTLMVLIIS